MKVCVRDMERSSNIEGKKKVEVSLSLSHSAFQLFGDDDDDNLIKVDFYFKCDAKLFNVKSEAKKHDKMHNNIYILSNLILLLLLWTLMCMRYVWVVFYYFYFSCMNYNGRKQHIKVKVFSYFFSLSLHTSFSFNNVEIEKWERKMKIYTWDA